VNPTASFPLGTSNVTLIVDDGNGETATTSTSVTVHDSTAPAVSAGADMTVEATSTLGAAFDVASQVVVSDSCCAVSTNISPAGLYALGVTTVKVTGSDCSNNSASDQMVVTVVDTTAPTVTATLVAVDLKKNKGKFRVEFSATDIVDANPVIVATLNGTAVTNGQIVELKRKKHAKVEFEHGELEVEGMTFSLDVSATDASGNTGSASALFTFPKKGHDKHHDKDHDDEDEGDDHDKKSDKKGGKHRD